MLVWSTNARHWDVYLFLMNDLGDFHISFPRSLSALNLIVNCVSFLARWNWFLTDAMHCKITCTLKKTWNVRWLAFLPPANEVCEGYVLTPICQSFCSQEGGGIPACLAAGLRGCIPACLAGFQAHTQPGGKLRGLARGVSRITSKGKVEGSPGPHLGGSPGPHPGGVLSQHALKQTPPDSYCCGQYASYWNAFLFCFFVFGRTNTSSFLNKLFCRGCSVIMALWSCDKHTQLLGDLFEKKNPWNCGWGSDN